MSTLTFYVPQADAPSEDELIQQQAIRGMIATVLDVPIEKLTSGWTCGSHREFRCSAHAERIPQEWVRNAHALVATGFFRCGFRFDGEIEEERATLTVEVEHEGKRYKGIIKEQAHE